MRRAAPTLALVAALALPGSAGAAATRAEYAAQADPYCAAANADVAQLNKRARVLFNRGKFKAAGGLLRKTGRRLSASIEEVRAIPPPPGDEQLIPRWLALIEKVAANNVKMGKAEATQRLGRVRQLERSNEGLRDKAHALVTGFPFAHCS
jgi:hypothetical protein